MLADWADAGAAGRNANAAAIQATAAFAESHLFLHLFFDVWTCTQVTSTHGVSAYSGIDRRKRKGRRGTRDALLSVMSRGDQLVCWIAESIQLPPRGRTKVQTSVASTG